MAETESRRPVNRLLNTLLMLAGWLLLAAGTWGAWVWTEAAPLRALGIDLAEYVKFVAEVRNGQVSTVREVFYLPLAFLSLSLSLLAHRAEFRLGSGMRWLLNLLALPAALALLPPAWTPALLLTAEFVKQTLLMGLCLAAAVASYPLLRGWPARLTAALVAGMAIASAVAPVIAFLRLRPALDAIYGSPIVVGPGPWLTLAGLVLVSLATLRALH